MSAKPGDLIYVQQFKNSPKDKMSVQFNKGRGMALLLGQHHDHVPEPTPHHLFTMIGRIGFLSFDDLKEFLGPELALQAIEKFELKYYGPAIENGMPAKAKGLIILPPDAEN